MKLKSIITISGRISSGKSYAAKLIAKQFGFPIASFGSYLKYYCEKNNLQTDRETLQNLGDNFIQTNPQLFLNNVIAYSIGKSNSIIIEGVRHKIIFDTVKHLADKSISVFIDADQKTRYERYYKRNKESDRTKDYNQFLISDTHSVELEIESLKPLCDIIINSATDYSIELPKLILQKLN